MTAPHPGPAALAKIEAIADGLSIDYKTFAGIVLLIAIEAGCDDDRSTCELLPAKYTGLDSDWVEVSFSLNGRRATARCPWPLKPSARAALLSLRQSAHELTADLCSCCVRGGLTVIVDPLVTRG